MGSFRAEHGDIGPLPAVAGPHFAEDRRVGGRRVAGGDLEFPPDHFEPADVAGKDLVFRQHDAVFQFDQRFPRLAVADPEPAVDFEAVDFQFLETGLGRRRGGRFGRFGRGLPRPTKDAHRRGGAGDGGNHDMLQFFGHSSLSFSERIGFTPKRGAGL